MRLYEDNYNVALSFSHDHGKDDHGESFALLYKGKVTNSSSDFKFCIYSNIDMTIVAIRLQWGYTTRAAGDWWEPADNSIDPV